jgi:hypothetical protein
MPPSVGGSVGVVDHAALVKGADGFFIEPEQLLQSFDGVLA